MAGNNKKSGGDTEIRMNPIDQGTLIHPVFNTYYRTNVMVDRFDFFSYVLRYKFTDFNITLLWLIIFSLFWPSSAFSWQWSYRCSSLSIKEDLSLKIKYWQSSWWFLTFRSSTLLPQVRLPGNISWSGTNRFSCWGKLHFWSGHWFTFMLIHF